VVNGQREGIPPVSMVKRSANVASSVAGITPIAAASSGPPVARRRGIRWQNDRMLRISTLLLLLVAPAVAFASPTPLTSTVLHAPVDPAVVVVPASAGKTILERYRTRTSPTSGTPLVVIVRLADASSPDQVAVTDAHRDGTKITITIESRRYVGALSANVMTTPFVEIALGDLPKATYSVDIDEQVLDFTKVDAPQTASKRHRGLQSSITLTIQ
jgi:hypothetical protein